MTGKTHHKVSGNAAAVYPWHLHFTSDIRVDFDVGFHEQ